MARLCGTRLHAARRRQLPTPSRYDETCLPVVRTPSTRSTARRCPSRLRSPARSARPATPPPSRSRPRPPSSPRTTARRACGRRTCCFRRVSAATTTHLGEHLLPRGLPGAHVPRCDDRRGGDGGVAASGGGAHRADGARRKPRRGPSPARTGPRGGARAPALRQPVHPACRARASRRGWSSTTCPTSRSRVSSSFSLEDKLNLLGRDICTPPDLFYNTTFTSHGEVVQTGSTQATIEGCQPTVVDPTALAKLRKATSDKPRLRVKVDDGSADLSKVVVKAPRESSIQRQEEGRDRRHSRRPGAGYRGGEGEAEEADDQGSTTPTT